MTTWSQINSIPNSPRLSTDADIGFSECIDTLKVFVFKKIIDLDILLPAWFPVESYDHIGVLEGTVIPKPNSKHIDTHVSPSDFPMHHFTHDVSFNVRPDSTEDNRYTNLLANKVFPKSGSEKADTVLMEYIHCEWESGLASFNDGNPCSELNNRGKSCGFFSEGHERRDIIWNWPTLGDWVHVEGLWLWDRGHPPAKTEIHPIRLSAVRRLLPAQLKKTEFPELKGEVTYATRIDIFASGDGGALNNNRVNTPKYVNTVKMSDKDYKFRIAHIISRPSSNAELKYIVKTQKGDSYNGNLNIIAYPNGEKTLADPFLEISIPWKSISDTAVFARSVYAYWDEGNGMARQKEINSYKVTLKSLKFRKTKELLSKSEFRVFFEVGGDWIFFNEFIEVDEILSNGIGKTNKKKWEINQEFIVHVRKGDSFRVHAGGWEADGIDQIMGTLMDPYSPCNSTTKEWVNKTMKVASPLRFNGCLDDHIGEVHAMHYESDLGDGGNFNVLSDGRREIDFCPCNSGKQENIFELSYSIEKLQ